MLEREILCNNVLPELQQYCLDRDVDLECCTFFETEDHIKNVEQYLLVEKLLKEEQTIALVIE